LMCSCLLLFGSFAFDVCCGELLGRTLLTGREGG
jgi:hypothetical protein